MSKSKNIEKDGKEEKLSTLRRKITVQKAEILYLKRKIRELEKQLTSSGKIKEKLKKLTVEEKKQNEQAQKDKERDDLRAKLIRRFKRERDIGEKVQPESLHNYDVETSELSLESQERSS